MKLCHIVAVDQKNCIGKGNELPWHIPTDLKFFKTKTKGHPVIMGRKTFESIGRPLPHRLNVVLSRQKDLDLPEGVLLCAHLDEALEAVKSKSDSDLSEIFIVGGAQVYKNTLDLVDRIYITRVATEVEDGDAFYPHIPNTFKLVSECKDHDVYELNFQTYER